MNSSCFNVLYKLQIVTQLQLQFTCLQLHYVKQENILYIVLLLYVYYAPRNFTNRLMNCIFDSTKLCLDKILNIKYLLKFFWLRIPCLYLPIFHFFLDMRRRLKQILINNKKKHRGRYYANYFTCNPRSIQDKYNFALSWFAQVYDACVKYDYFFDHSMPKDQGFKQQSRRLPLCNFLLDCIIKPLRFLKKIKICSNIILFLFLFFVYLKIKRLQ